MINRLVAESTVKVPFKGEARFSTSKKLLAFQGETQLRVKALSREAKDIEVAFNNAPLQASLSQTQNWLYELTPGRLLQVHQLEYLNGIAEGSSKKIAILHNVEQYREISSGLLVVASNRTLKAISFRQMAQQTELNLNIDANSLPALADLQGDFILHTSPHSSRVLLTRCSREQAESGCQAGTEVWERVEGEQRFERVRVVTYLNCVLALYRDRFAFQRRLEKEVEIFDIEESRLVGRFPIEGSLKFAQLAHNLLLLVTSREQTDYCHFLILASDPLNSPSLVTHRAVYEKGRGDYYQLCNLLTAEANVILDKKKGSDFGEGSIARVAENTSSVLYVLNKAKEKVEIIKLDHSKVLKSPFTEEKLDQVVYSKPQQHQPSPQKPQPVHPPTQNAEFQRARVKAGVQAKVGGRSMEELQKEFVQSLIDIKLRGVVERFQRLERRVESLQRVLGGISEKVEASLARINRQQIRLNVEKLFDSLTPQFQRYFKEIFNQVAGVLEQGVGYYNLKLAKEAELHKEALAQIVTETFKATEDIVQIGRREQAISERTEDHLRRILDSKRRWTKSTEDYEARLREVPTPSLREGKQNPPDSREGKVFVRADLNFPASRREG